MAKMTLGEMDIFYTTQGNGDTLLIFPDNLHASAAYTQEIACFASRFHVLSFDYPGAGRSSRQLTYQDERDYDLWNYYADLGCHILQNLQIDTCYVLGSGFGAWAALHFAGKQARLHHITPQAVIADSFLSTVDARTLHRTLDMREHYYVRRAAWLAEQHGPDWRQVVDADTAFLRRLADHGGYAFPDGILKTIPCPVLLTGALQDLVTPGIAADYARISAHIPTCSLFLVHSANHRYGDEHPLMWTAPDIFRSVVSQFLPYSARLKRDLNENQGFNRPGPA